MRFRVLLLLIGGIFVGCAHGDDEARRRGSARAPSAPAVESAPVESVTPSAIVTAAPRRLPLAGGRAVLVDGDDHVVVLEADGGAGAESWCGANAISYSRAAAFWGDVIRHVKAHDKNALANLMQFPLHASVSVKSREDFLRNYEQIFTPNEVSAITSADPGEVFCRNGAFMLGNGEIWAEPDANGAYRIITINAPIPHARKRG